MRSGLRFAVIGLAAVSTTVWATPVVAAGASQPLVGTFRIAAGACEGGVSGSTFRMVLPSGNASGPFVSNNDSTCSDQTYTLLAPGTDGGLVTGGRQPEPNPAFDGSGNSLAARITKPVRFYGVDFSTSTNPTDPQTGASVPSPSVAAQMGKLSGDLRAFAASWNRQEFNQGAPKPDGSTPGNTATPTGTYDASTGAFVLTWASQIQGGPFNNFTGVWHIEGSFVPASPGSATAASPGGSSGGATSPTTASPQRAPAPVTAPFGNQTTATLPPGSAPAPATAAPAPSVDTPTTAPEPNTSVEPAAGSTVAASQSRAAKPGSHTGARGAPTAIGLLALVVLAAVGGSTWVTIARRGPRQQATA